MDRGELEAVAGAAYRMIPKGLSPGANEAVSVLLQQPRGLPTLVSTLWKNRMAVIGSIVLLGVLASAIFAPWIARSDPTDVDLGSYLTPPAWQEGGTREHLLGTDHLGRDVFSRMLFGARVSMLVSFATVIISGGLGVSLGMIAGYYGGKVDDIIIGVAQVQQSFPFIGLAIAVVAVLGPGLQNTVLVLGVSGWVLFARLVRGEVLSVREEDYIEAARAVGAGNLRIMFRHILPNISSPLIVMASFVFALIIIVEASLSFVGLGIQPPQSSWGLMLSEARNYMESAWWLPTFPGLAIVITVLGANMLGDWLRDTLDPRLRDV